MPLELRRGTAGIAAAVLLLPALAAGSATARAAPWPMCLPRRVPVQLGIRELGRVHRGRLITLALRSRAMGNIQHVDVLLPRHYDRSRRYRVLYLLHGAGGDYRSWIDHGVQRLLGNLPVIAVMPSGTQNGQDGAYSDWYGTPSGSVGPVPAWESYHIRELLPFIDSHFPTLPTAAGRAIAGISMGGGGATKYAAEYPGTFGYVGTFSGEAHPLLPVAVAFQPKTCKWGDPAIEQVIWRDNDSADLAGNLRGVRIFIRSGNGKAGPYDLPSAPSDPIQAAIWRFTLLIEYGAHLENEALANALRHDGIHDIDVRFFAGSHTQPYWNRDTRQFVTWLRVQFRHPPRPLPAFDVASAHMWFAAWGWSFQVQRRIREFVYVQVGRGGRRITAVGSGRLSVHAPGGSTFVMNLGPSHAYQQTRFGSSATRHLRRVTFRLNAGVWSAVRRR